MSALPATQNGQLRADLAAISNWIEPGSRILDLGCGDGTLLEHLTRERQVRGYGLEIDSEKVAACVARGVNVMQIDLDDGLKDFATDSFDYVVLTLTLQALARPDKSLTEMLRVGRRAIVTFPNFGHWRVRLKLLGGRMPTTPSLPEQWYETPNIHFCTVQDFESLCEATRWRRVRKRLLDQSLQRGSHLSIWPNLFAEVALYLLED